MPAIFTLALLLFLALSPPASAGEIRREPVAAGDSIGRLRVAEGFAVELAAAEPEVADPVALAFDERGRMWVVEMPDYPAGPAPGSGPGGRITILEDPRGEGRYRRASVFA